MIKKALQIRFSWIYGIVLMLLGSTFLFSLCVGKYPISSHEIFDILLRNPVEVLSENVFLTLRLPRTIMVVIAGFGLSVAGSVYQTVFKNPLASPDIIGTASAASVGAAFAIVFLGAGPFMIALCAFCGGLMAVIFLLGLVAMTHHKDLSTYVLSGIVINTFTHAIIMLFKFFADPERQLAPIEFWIMGGFGNLTYEKVLVVLPFFMAGFSGILLLRWQIMILSLSDDESKMLGVRLQWVRSGVLASSTLVVASIISVTGMISFIGLIAPHIALMLFKKNSFHTFMLSGVIGSVLLLIADCMARMIADSEVPISILTSLLGAPFLAYFMCRRKRI